MCRMMKLGASELWEDENGVLSFEWVLLLTLLTIGIVGGLVAARDAIVDELGDVAQAMVAVDNSFTIDFPLSILIDGVQIGGASDSRFTDFAVYQDCDRASGGPDQAALTDNDS